MRGFSLVELSIVLVILGLLTGGILAGQSLIRAAELRAVSTEDQRFSAAAHAFRDKYFAKPGDFRDATRFWNLQVSGSNCVTNSGASVASPGVCDGNGDGAVAWDASGAASTAAEAHQFWRHLAAAGLIEGTYTGLAGPSHVSAEVVPGTNAPRSRLGNAGWGAGQNNCGTSNCFQVQHTQMQYPPYFAFGRQVMSSGNNPLNSVLTPPEAWNIDTKMDDGHPSLGKVVAFFDTANRCTTAASNTDATGAYRLSSETVDCAMFFLNAF